MLEEEKSLKGKEIICLGDSILKGIVNENYHFSVTKNSFANICARQLGVELINSSKMGSTITKGISIFDFNEEKYKEKSGSYIVFEFGGNDCDFPWSEIGKNPKAPHWSNTNINYFHVKYVELINRAKSIGLKPVLLTLPPIDINKYFEYFSGGSNRDNILEWLEGDKLFVNTWHEMYNLEVFKIAAECGLPLIDITSCFYKIKNHTQLICIDGLHPTEAGHKLIADSILEQLSLKGYSFEGAE